MSSVDDDSHDLVRDALAILGIERLVLAIHDVSFPSTAAEDTGYGSPYSEGARDFFEFARDLGFDGVQLGPQGQTTLGNLSPYDGSVFSKSVLSLPLGALASARYGSLLSKEWIGETVARTPAGDARAHHAHAFAASETALTLATRTFLERRERGDPEARALSASIESFTARAAWLDHDATFEAFAALHGTDDLRTWPEADRNPSKRRIAEVERDKREVVEAWRLGQTLIDRAHTALRERLSRLGLRLYGDLQVGLSLRDRFARSTLFMPGYALGAPPSRTNPEGQPWGYPVFDPRGYLSRFVDADESPILAFVRSRITKLFGEFDGVRIDHPHGIVCPWVYDVTGSDPLLSVAHGARLFETPSSPTHPRLADLTIVRPEQIDPDVPAYDDMRVRHLDGTQIDEYSRLLDLVIASARTAGKTERDVLCEVLSTCPRPLAAVMQRHGLGRFRVTQKASLTDAQDGYRGENARRADWTMLGNHDTDPIRRVIERWTDARTLEARAAYLATRLEPDLSKREPFAQWLLSHPARLATGMFAELFVGPAANVLVFWADLFGERDVYNTPGVSSKDNWSMRVPRSFRTTYRSRIHLGEALDVPSALVLALRAHPTPEARRLCSALERRAKWRLG